MIRHVRATLRFLARWLPPVALIGLAGALLAFALLQLWFLAQMPGMAAPMAFTAGCFAMLALIGWKQHERQVSGLIWWKWDVEAQLDAIRQRLADLEAKEPPR